jgi:hypothetical protein
MARFYGRVGYGSSEESAPGVWTDTIVERLYFGDVVRNMRHSSDGENLNNEITVRNLVSIVADDYATSHIQAIKYVEYSGILWTVTDVEVQRPRLILRLGEVYNGPTP